MHARHLPALRRLALALAPLLATSAACDDGGGGGSTADAVADATGGPDTGTPTDTAASDVPDASDAADTAADTGLAPDSAGTEDVPDSSPGCVDACTAGAVACDGAARIVCVHGDNGCLVWSAPTACGAGTACVAGRCDPLPPARFAAAPTAWAVPALGGADDAGFYALSGTPGAVGYDVWATTDLTGDGLPDLVVTGRAGEKAGYDWFSRV
ncbi:MAG: hypothetical protein KC635_13070, partial [Myxococcales bacterium]|nr:hypothetical protein [Myxococcales bacterium]